MRKFGWLLVYVAAVCSSGCRSTGIHRDVSVHDAASLLPPIPLSVPSAMGPVPVVWGDSLKDADGKLIFAGFHPARRVIYLSRQLELLPAWHALYHERCHVTMWDTGIVAEVPMKIQQQLCEQFATASVADMLLARRR